MSPAALLRIWADLFGHCDLLGAVVYARPSNDNDCQPLDAA